MKLLDYLKEMDGDYEKALKMLAKKAKSTPLYINRIAKGWQPPGPKFAIRLVMATEGRVTRNDLRPDLWPVAISEPISTEKSVQK